MRQHFLSKTGSLSVPCFSAFAVLFGCSRDPAPEANEPALQTGAVGAELASSLIFSRMFGTSGTDGGQSIAADAAGNVYVAGWAEGSIDGNPWVSGTDVVLAKYTNDGTRLWSREFGSTGADSGSGVAVDSTGNVYVVGYVEHPLSGQSGAGGRDAFLTKYSSDGTRQWIREFGTSADDFAQGVSTDSAGNVYVVGDTSGGLDGNVDGNGGSYSAFVAKYSGDGLRIWTTQFASSSNTDGTGVSAPDSAGNVYVTGYAYESIDGGPSLPAQHFYLAKLSGDGQRVWTKQTTPSDGILLGSGIATRDGNIYASGFSAQQQLAVVAYDGAGTLLWTQEPQGGYGGSLATDSTGAVYVGGAAMTAGSDDFEALVVKLSPSGAVLGSLNTGMPEGYDGVLGLAVDPADGVFTTGPTFAAFPGTPNLGDQDGFIQKLRL
jgi:hypothetical protein